MQQKGYNTTLSVGRVQSSLTYMIYQRQKEIEGFVSEPFYELVGKFNAAKGEFEGKAKVKTDTLDELIAFLLEKGTTLQSELQGAIKTLDKKEKVTKSPKLHSLSTLQTVANKKWKYSPAIVLSTMQNLYEKKIVSYPRTDCNFITESEFAYLSNNVDKYMQLIDVSFEPNKIANKRYVEGSQVAEHYAIIPTKTVPSESVINSLSVEEKNIYDEVLRNTLAMFHKDYRYEETKIITTVNEIEFETIGKVELDKGWKSLFSHQKDDEVGNSDSNNVLPVVFEEEKVVSLLNRKEGHTSPPKPFTEGGLINLMKTAGKMVEDKDDSAILKEVEGIGTEATRSGIIETVKKNEYIEVKKNIVYITTKGEILCEAIQGTLLASPSMTAKWEGYLKKIGSGEGSSNVFLSNITKFIINLIETAPEKLGSKKIEGAVIEQKASESIGTCSCCKRGQMIDHKTFISCSEYKNGCKFSISRTIASKKLTDKNIKDLLEKGVTSTMKGFKSSKGKSFDAKLKVVDGKVSFIFDNSKN